FNTHFEFYGRRIRLLFFAVNGYSDGGQHAAAVDAASRHPFAATAVSSTCVVFDTTMYSDAVAEQHVITTLPEVGYRTLPQLMAHRPYEWSYAPPLDVTERNLAA